MSTRYGGFIAWTQSTTALVPPTILEDYRKDMGKYEQSNMCFKEYYDAIWCDGVTG